MLSKKHKDEQDNNHAMLLKVIQKVRFLARQGLPFRGSEGEDNFTQLLKLRGTDDNRVVGPMDGEENEQFYVSKNSE